MTTLTIAIPTYNRAQILSESFSHHSKLVSRFSDLSLAIRDNFSNPDPLTSLYPVLHGYEKHISSRISLTRNSANIGVFPSIFELIRTCDSDYILLLSDEDILCPQEVTSLLDFLSKSKPAFVSTSLKKNGRFYRGSKSNRIIKVDEWFTSSFYISGLIFNVQKAQKIIDANRDAMLQENLFYVLGLVASEFIAHHKDNNFFYKKIVVSKRHYAPTTISSSSKNPYWSLASRALQYEATLRYFDSRINDPYNKHFIQRYRCMKQWYSFFFFHTVQLAIAKRSSDEYKSFMKGVYHYSFGPFAPLINWLNSFDLHPLRAIGSSLRPRSPQS